MSFNVIKKKMTPSYFTLIICKALLIFYVQLYYNQMKLISCSGWILVQNWMAWQFLERWQKRGASWENTTKNGLFRWPKVQRKKKLSTVVLANFTGRAQNCVLPTFFWQKNHSKKCEKEKVRDSLTFDVAERKQR